MGGDVVHILQSCVDHMALVSVHGLQSGAAAGLQNLLCLLAGIAAEAVLTLFPVALSIHIDADVAFHVTVDGVVGQMLDGIQGVATATDQVAQIFTHQINLVGVAVNLAALRNRLRVHVLQQTLDEDFNLLLHRAGLSGGVGSNGSLLLHLGLGLLFSLGCLGLGSFGLLFGLLLRLGGLVLLLGLGSLCLGGLSLGSFRCLGCLRLLYGGSLGLGAGSAAQGALGFLRNLLHNGIGNLVSDLYLGQLCAETQETGLCLLQHLNRNAVPIQTQLKQSGFNGKVNIVPGEVERYYKSADKDDLPTIGEQYVYAHITKFPSSLKEAQQRTKERLLDMRERIITGQTKFSVLARMYSLDGSAMYGGEMEPMPAAYFVRPFAEALEKLKPGQVSEIVETEFGFHIIELIEKRGDIYHCRHILLRPTFTYGELAEPARELDSIARPYAPRHRCLIQYLHCTSISHRLSVVVLHPRM